MGWTAGAWLALALALTQAPGPIRFAQLSLANDGVELWRTGEGWRPAPQNLPLVAGMRLRDDGAGKAEIQLECGSTVRLTGGAELMIQQLSLRDPAVPVTTMSLLAGTSFVNLASHTDGGDFRLLIPGGEVRARDGIAQFRVDLGSDGGKARVRVAAGHLTATFEKQEYALASGQEVSLEAAKHGDVTRTPREKPDEDANWSEDQDYKERPLVPTYDIGSRRNSSDGDFGTKGSLRQLEMTKFCRQ